MHKCGKYVDEQHWLTIGLLIYILLPLYSLNVLSL